MLLLLCACLAVSAEEGDAELLAMKTSQLLQKGRERGVSHGALERCMDDDDTKQCVVTAIHAREADVAAMAFIFIQLRGGSMARTALRHCAAAYRRGTGGCGALSSTRPWA